jgi:Ankyrin repeats (3 copies)
MIVCYICLALYILVGTRIHDRGETGEKIKGYISDFFTKWDIEEKCEYIIYKFLINPPEHLVREAWFNHNNNELLKLLPFFIWAAKENRADLFDSSYFLALLPPSGAAEIAGVAALYGSHEFIIQGIKKGIFNKNAIHGAIYMAVVADNTETILSIEGALGWVIDYKNITYSVKGDYSTHTYEPLSLAVSENKLNSLEFLLKRGGDPNGIFDKISKDSYLHIAARSGHVKCVELLCQYGALIDIKDYFGKTPLQDVQGMTNPNPEIVAVLQKYVELKQQLQSNIANSGLINSKATLFQTNNTWNTNAKEFMPAKSANTKEFTPTGF